MRTLLALLLAALAGSHDTEFDAGVQKTGQCVAVFHTDIGFSGRSIVAALPGDGNCYRYDSGILSAPSRRRLRDLARSGHFWARAGCRLKVYRGSTESSRRSKSRRRNCDRWPWLDLGAGILSQTQFVNEIGTSAMLLPGVRHRQYFGEARCTCGAAALSRLPAANGSFVEGAEDEEEEEESEDDAEEDVAREEDDDYDAKGAVEEDAEEDMAQEEDDDDEKGADGEEGDMAQEEDDAKGAVEEEAEEEEDTVQEEGALSMLEEEESTWSHRRRARAKREHRACSYLFWREASWPTSPHYYGKVRKNKCVTFRSSIADDFDSGYAIADPRCQLKLYFSPGCTSHGVLFSPANFTPFGAQGTARLMPDFGGWTGEFKSAGCRCV